MENDHLEKQKNNKNEVELKKLDLWDKLIDHISPVIDYFKARLEKHDAPIAKSTVIGIIIIICIIIGSSALLVAFDKLPDSAFTFVIGTIVGFLLSMAKMFFKQDNN